ncbi:MAG: YajQ family cyclic di-GMP-binding protein [Mariprofundales bacterium]
MPSFDIVSQVDTQELDNAINLVKRELANRYDFKHSKASIEIESTQIVISAEDDQKVNTVAEILRARLVRRKLDPRCLDYGNMETAGGNMRRQQVRIVQGVDKELAKKLVKHIKDAKLKVQASIQGEQIRVTGKKRDDLQQVMELMRKENIDIPLQFINFRD